MKALLKPFCLALVVFSSVAVALVSFETRLSFAERSALFEARVLPTSVGRGREGAVLMMVMVVPCSLLFWSDAHALVPLLVELVLDPFDRKMVLMWIMVLDL